MSTIRSIAERANVSIATVSKVLNGKNGVREETRQMILNVAQELNYRPNLNARSLKSGRARTIGIIAEDLTVFNTPEIIDGIAVSCDRVDYHYVLANLRIYKRFGHKMPEEKVLAEIVRDAIDVLLARQVVGIIYIGHHSHVIPFLPQFSEVPVVCAYCICHELPSVIYDDERASYDLTQLLINHGCRRIGMITGPLDSSHSASRSMGHMRALFDNKIPYDPRLTLPGDWERDIGYEIAGTLLNAGVDAIYAQNDVMAMGVLDYCNAVNVSVGRDLRLFGFDDREFSLVTRPRLSSVAPPLFEIGQTAADELLQILAGGESKNQQIKLNCKIIERESSLGLEEKE